MDDHDVMGILNNGNAHEIGPCEDLLKYKEEGISSEIESVVEEVADSNNVGAFKELQVRDTDESTQPKLQNAIDNVKNRKALGIKNDTKHNIDTKGLKKLSVVKQSITHEKKNVALKNRQVVDNNLKQRNLVKGHLSKQNGKLDAISPSGNVVQPEGNKSSVSGDEKPQRLATLPVYNFSFKCNERAEKRKEFYSKLEEKIHAKEMENCNLQAKTKENQEAEIKMFRKSLTFKASPMPSFYKEPLPPRTDLKKIPATQAKSPKFGRKKELPTRDNETNNSAVFQMVRSSLDEKKPRSKTTTNGPFPGPLKKPVRSSLPRLPSEKTKLPSKTNKMTKPSRETNEEKTKLPSKSHEADSPTGPVEEKASS